MEQVVKDLAQGQDQEDAVGDLDQEMTNGTPQGSPQPPPADDMQEQDTEPASSQPPPVGGLQGQDTVEESSQPEPPSSQ